MVDVWDNYNALQEKSNKSQNSYSVKPIFMEIRVWIWHPLQQEAAQATLTASICSSVHSSKGIAPEVLHGGNNSLPFPGMEGLMLKYENLLNLHSLMNFWRAAAALTQRLGGWANSGGWSLIFWQEIMHQGLESSSWCMEHPRRNQGL